MGLSSAETQYMDMSVVGDFTVPAHSFALSHTLSAAPRTTVEADRLASHSSMEVLPFIWATGEDLECFDRALGEDPTVESVTVAEETEQEVLYRIVWDSSVRRLIDEVVDHHAAITEASASDETWRFRLRFAEPEMVSEFQDHFRETGRQFDVERLNRPTEPRQHVHGLTEEQQEALVAAVAEGYFSIPRRISAEELGEALGISANAASQRLRRGSDALIRSVLAIGDEIDDDTPHQGT